MRGVRRVEGRSARDPSTGLGSALARLEAMTGFRVLPEHKIIAEAETFRQWCERLATQGMRVDGRPFTLSDRPAMAWIYDQVPSTKAEAYRSILVLMKCAQVGFTVLEMLATIYIGLKFGPATIGMFLPDMNLAGVKSTERFMPIVRSVPAVHALMTQDAADGSGRRSGEGNVTRRRIGDALFVFSWTSGRATTESIPMSMVSYDEVQEMTLAQMEKTQERLSASDLRYTLMGSTANWPDSDIHHWYKLGTRHRFMTECPACLSRKPLDEYFPDSIRWDPDAPGEGTALRGRYRYVCPNGHWIDDPQRGEWVAEDPEARVISIHFHQMLSPTISPGEIMSKYLSSTDKKNFHNRVLGKPYLDPTEIPVTLEHMARCVEEGRRMGLSWKSSAKDTFLGIDQMGAFSVCVIKERLRDGRQAVVHLEEIYSDDPFGRCDELVELYGVQAGVVEINPNYNEAKRFANRHKGKIFLCNGFGSLPDDMIRWGDAPAPSTSDRRMDEEERDRYTVKCDQFKCMQTSMARFTAKTPLCLFPDPQALVQEVIDKGVRQPAPVAPRAFLHFTKTALRAERDEETNGYKRKVVKVGIDPHFSYANQLCDVAWARAYGTASFILPDATPSAEDHRVAALEKNLPGLPAHVMAMIQGAAIRPGTCGSCFAYPRDGLDIPAHGLCSQRKINTAAAEPGCPFHVARS